MERVLDLPEAPPEALLDGAIALALATGATLQLAAKPTGADLEVLAAAARMSGEAAENALRSAPAGSGPVRIALSRPRAGSYSIELREPSSAARVAVALSWPLSLVGRPSELRLRGPNHSAGVATFHDLRLAWAPLAAAFGLLAQLELRAAAFAWDPAEQGELVLSLDPAPALTPLHRAHRGLLRQVTLVGASGAGGQKEALRASGAAERKLRLRGVNADAERVPLPLPPSASQHGNPARRWALTAVAEFEHAVVSMSGVPQAASPSAWPSAAASGATGATGATGSPEAADAAESELVGSRVADALSRFLSSRGALDGQAAERALIPAILCAAGLGARAGPPPLCHFTTTEVTVAQVALAALAHKVVPVRAVIDGAPGEEGVVVVAP
jgi:RNA 3'-terminal phosphate cyclase